MKVEDLVLKAQNGDAEAFAKLCTQFEGLMKKAAGQPHFKTIYEDALAVGYESFVEAVKLYRPLLGVPFAGFAKSKVKYALWNLFKRERRRWQMETALESSQGEDLTLLDTLAADIDIEAQIETKLLGGALFDLLDTLPVKQRQAVLLTVVLNQKLAEAAALLGVTPQAVHSLKKRALKALKNAAAK